MSLGVNRSTGQILSGFDHVRQSLGVILTTRLGSRVMRRTFGSAIPALLGQPLTPPDLMRWYMAAVIAIELWEPRFRIASVAFPSAANSEGGMQQGRLGLVLTGIYYPNALNGDFTPAGSYSVSL